MMFMLCQAAGEAFVCVVCVVSFGWGAGKGLVLRAFTAVPGRCVARCLRTTWHARILTCVRARVHTHLLTDKKRAFNAQITLHCSDEQDRPPRVL